MSVSPQMQCKLFVFDKPVQSWVERGRGLLRLNDMASTEDGTLQSRLGKSSAESSLEQLKCVDVPHESASVC